MSDNGQFAISLLYFQAGRIGFDTKDIVVDSIHDHVCGG